MRMSSSPISPCPAAAPFREQTVSGLVGASESRFLDQSLLLVIAAMQYCDSNDHARSEANRGLQLAARKLGAARAPSAVISNDVRQGTIG